VAHLLHPAAVVVQARVRSKGRQCSRDEGAAGLRHVLPTSSRAPASSPSTTPSMWSPRLGRSVLSTPSPPPTHRARRSSPTTTSPSTHLGLSTSLPRSLMASGGGSRRGGPAAADPSSAADLAASNSGHLSPLRPP
jgi:hypothetical protein